MRKFNVRWWVTPDLLQWKMMQAAGDYCGPFYQFPEINNWAPQEAMEYVGPLEWHLS